MNLDKLADIQKSYDYIGVSGVDSSNKILMGRPYGSVAVLWNGEIFWYIQRVKTDNKRLCAVSFKPNNVDDISLISVYMPY